MDSSQVKANLEMTTPVVEDPENPYPYNADMQRYGMIPCSIIGQANTDLDGEWVTVKLKSPVPHFHMGYTWEVTIPKKRVILRGVERGGVNAF